MTTPYTEVIAETTVWVEATAVRVDVALSISLQETTGGAAQIGTIAVGTYTKATFSLTLKNLLDALSFNDYVYTVEPEQINYDALPDTDPIKWGSSFRVTKTGAGNFVLIIT
jgi:hypothetical protein